MNREEFEMLLHLLRKFNQDSGESILDMEIKIVNFAKSTPLFQVRESVFMDDKMAYEHDMQMGEDKLEKYQERERNDNY